MKYCSKNHSNTDDAIFCSECGEKLKQTSITRKKMCSKCKAENPEEAEFCHVCGWQLSEQYRKIDEEADTGGLVGHIKDSFLLNYQYTEAIIFGKVGMWACNIISVISMFIFIRGCINQSIWSLVHLAIIISYIGICYQKIFWAIVWLIALFILLISFTYILSIVNFNFGIIMELYPLQGIIILCYSIAFAITLYKIYNRRFYFEK